ncbi:hypothetical protein MUK42_30526 [Musa troglodytarum]|uniref:Secreted protein n=1 Tax=Musa troglodytarum TaxID=320322 RepID=A0A9E7JWD7_9LILI|nr:hypothetical protein MUK42_30526 [Musa troglodytarum]
MASLAWRAAATAAAAAACLLPMSSCSGRLGAAWPGLEWPWRRQTKPSEGFVEQCLSDIGDAVSLWMAVKSGTARVDKMTYATNAKCGKHCFAYKVGSRQRRANKHIDINSAAT